MRREKLRPTRYPGVELAGDGVYRIRGKTKDPKTGKSRELDRVIEASSAAKAAEQRADLLAKLIGAEATGQRVRLSTFLDIWIARKKSQVAPSTLDRYARTLQQHVLPALGDHYVDALTHSDIAKWRDDQTDQASSVNSRLRVLKTAVADAVVEYELGRDPSARVSALREASGGDGEPDDDGALLTPEELDAFLSKARELSPTWHPLLATLAYTAMRVGEGTALRWEDIDEGEALVRVRRAQWRGRIGPTKTKRRRSVPLVEPLAAILREHRRWLVATQHPGLASGWVFPAAKVRKPRADGSWPPVSTSSLRKPLRAVLKAVELEGRITTHGLRRTWNNILRQVTAGEVVRAITGHATERMTEHYSHVHQNEKAQAATRALSLVRAKPVEVGTLVGTEVTSNG